jgi:transposase
MRNINSFKLTIPPYTPEFNPVEHLFSKLKLISSDGAERSDLVELTGYIV